MLGVGSRNLSDIFFTTQYIHKQDKFNELFLAGIILSSVMEDMQTQLLLESKCESRMVFTRANIGARKENSAGGWGRYCC